jgi:TctA family transporter
MSMSRGNLLSFLDHPIVVTFLLLSVVFLVLPVLLRRRGAPRTLVDDDD